LVSDPKDTITQDYEVLKTDEGASFRGLLADHCKLPVGHSIDEILRLVQAFSLLTKWGNVQLARSLAVTPLSLMSKGAKNISPISSDC
jgi:alkyl hydroperoxide reductase subunit AhpC